MACNPRIRYIAVYVKYSTIGVCLCVLAPVPLLAAAFTEKDFLTMAMLCVTLLLVGIGVMLLISAGTQWESMQKLLKEGAFSKKGKKQSALTQTVGSVYWLSATAVYLAWSFLSGGWHITWMVWPVAGVLFAAVMAVCNFFADR